MTDLSQVARESAEQLIRIGHDLRTAGLDLDVVRLSDDGVTRQAVTLAGELELIAMRLDFDRCMEMAREARE